jgi:hypothetical protein
MLAGSLAERRLLSQAPASPVIVWRGSLAGNTFSGPVKLLAVDEEVRRRPRVDNLVAGVDRVAAQVPLLVR